LLLVAWYSLGNVLLQWVTPPVSLPVWLTPSADRQSPPTVWARSGGLAILYYQGTGSRATKQAWALAPQALELSVLRVGLFGYVLGHLHNLLCGPLADSYPAGRAKMIIRNAYPFVKAIWPLIQGQFRRFLDPRLFEKCLLRGA
jgi:hypothetical protein